MHEAEYFVGQMCLTYLSFSDFETQVAVRPPESKFKQPPDVISLGLASWISNLLGVPRALFEIPYRLLGRNLSTPAPSIDYTKYLRPASTPTDSAVFKKLSEKYQLLGYIVEYWMFHTKYFEASKEQLSQKLHEIARHKQLSFEFRPWGPNQRHGRHGCVSCVPSGATAFTAQKLPFMSMFHYAAEVGHWPLMEPLVNDYCSHEHGDDETLVIACRAAHLSIVQRLTQSYEFDLSNEKAINAAAASGDEKIFMYLLEAARTRYSFPVKQRGYRPLIIASANGHEAIVEILCQRGVGINGFFKNAGMSPLSAAAGNGHDHIVRNLIAKGARLLTTGTTPLHCAAENGHESVVSTLFEASVDYDHLDDPPNVVHPPHLNGALDQDGETPLHKASRNGHDAVVEILLRYSPRTRAWITADTGKGQYKQKAVHLAALNDHVGVLALLAEHVSIDERTSNGRTPLMLAAMEGHLSVMNFLIPRAGKGALDLSRDEDGLTAREFAVMSGHQDAVRTVLSIAPLFEAHEVTRILALAAREGHEAVLATLIDSFKGYNLKGFLSDALSLVTELEATQLLGAALEWVDR